MYTWTLEPTMLPSIGVFGTDKQAHLIIHLFKTAGFTVTTVCGQSTDTARRTAREFDVPFHTTKVQELLLHNDVDMVCVSGTPFQYSEVSVKALSIGKHVFTCVPCGLKIKDANKMLTAAEYYPMLLSLLNHPLRFIPAFIKARELINSGYIGNVFLTECTLHMNSLIGESYDWHCDVTTGGGILQTYGCHIIDILTFLLSEKAYEAHGIVDTFVKRLSNLPNFRQISSDDFSSFQLKYPSGARACVTLNANMPNNFLQEIMIVGTKGYLKINNCDLYGQLNSSGHVEELYIEENCTGQCVSAGGQDIPDMYAFGLEHLIDAIKMAFENIEVTGQFVEDKRLVDHNIIAQAANFEHGCYNRCVLDAILLSNKEKNWIAIKETDVESKEHPFWDLNESLLSEGVPQGVCRGTSILPRKAHRESHASQLRRIISQPVIYKRENEEEISFHEGGVDVGKFKEVKR